MTNERRPILVVEDDLDVRESLMDVLRDAGYDVESAADGAAALALLRSGLEPAVIILDLMMPVMNGFEFRAAQRIDPRLARIPVIVLTADRSVRARAHELMADEYVAKPARIEDLIESVRRLEPRAG